MKQFISFIIKEGKHIFRDKRTMLILFGMPVVMMLLYGFAISTDVRNVRTIVVTSTTDHLTQQVIECLGQSDYFTINALVPSVEDAKQMIRNQKAEMAVVFTGDFANKRYDSKAAIQIITDGTDPNMAQMYANYAQSVIMQTVAGNNNASLVSSKMLYNPQSKSAYNFVPGIMGMLLLLICTMMTSISIVREKERGTMEVLLVSPAKPLMIIIAKAVPYMLLSIFILVTILFISYYILIVPIAGGIGWIGAISLLYILLSLSLGLFISIIANTQLEALLGSAMVLLLPSVFLSGMMFPIESMPDILQYITAIIPNRYYISAMRKLMIMGVGIDSVLYEVGVLSVMTAVLLSVALLKFNKRLE
ncbi:MAG: ABC transporter permease [Phocaeicola sp.]|uniref:ABC transporter permease n=1 Tax=Phocaeicola sp. TaxID=2773926 RepID=UPI003FA11039